jgi:DNA-binding response OmpR family regulator
MRVLVVEDERPLADAIATGLRREGVAVDVAYDGTSAEHRLVVNDYDVVVLDRDLPGCTGRCLPRAGRAPAGHAGLMLTAASDVTDRVEGLGIGADDYLSKPFAFTELVARVRALGPA